MAVINARPEQVKKLTMEKFHHSQNVLEEFLGTARRQDCEPARSVTG